MTDDTKIDESVLTPGMESKQDLDDAISASSPEPQENEEKKHNGVQERFNKITAEKYKAIREAESLKREKEELEKKLSSVATPVTPQATTATQAPTYPDDPYDEEVMRKYHTDMVEYNKQIATESAKSIIESQQTASQNAAQEAQAKEVLNKWTQNAIKDGVNLDKLHGVEQTLNSAGIQPQLASYLMNDSNGAKVAEYLADNPAEMYEVLQMDPVSAGIKIAAEIKPKVLSETPNVSNAPDPIPNVGGSGGYVEKDEFDKSYPGAEFI